LPKLKFEVSNKPDKRIIERGDIVVIDKEPYLVAQTDWDKFNLVSLSDGNRWDDEGFEVGINFSVFLKEYIHDEAVFDSKESVELLKSNESEIIIRY
jgi:hypothetical protein